MEGMLTQEQYNEIRDKARIYAYNIMHDDEFTEEKYEADRTKIKELLDKGEHPYTDYNETNLAMNMEHLVQGYATYGRDYITGVISQDLDSSVNMFECCVQQVLDLTNTIRSYTAMLEKQVADFQDGSGNFTANTEENKEEIHNEEVKEEN